MTTDNMNLPIDEVSEVTRQLIERDRKGRAKYGTTLDRTDLGLDEWLQHLAEELMDGAGYALAAKRAALARQEADNVPNPWRELMNLQEFIDWNRSSGGVYVKPGFESVVLDYVRRYAIPPANREGPRYVAAGPQGIFWTGSLELARKLCTLIDPPDEDGSYDWTITDTLDPHGEALSKRDAP